MKSNKHKFKIKNQVIIIEHKNYFTKFTALKRILINRNESL